MASYNEGRTIGAYRIIEQIGVGGMATVYKAFQPSMERYVAIKILPQQHAQDPQFVERFIREARTIAKLEHKNILPVHDFGEEEGTTYLVMRYLEGGTLKDIMAQGRLTLSDIGDVISQMCSALDYAHRQGVIHRDVKPANVIIDNEGEAYLTDFGIAKALGGESDLTGTGVTIGTPAYMAPEQSLGKGVDARTDIYALGIILYEMVVGEAPYVADTPIAVVMAHIHEPLPLPRNIDPSIPEAIENVIIKALAKDPKDRHQTTSEMSAALNDAIRKSIIDRHDSTLINLVTEVVSIRAEHVIEEATIQEAQVEKVVEQVEDEVEKEIVEEVKPKEAEGPKPKSKRGLWIGLGAVLVITVISVVAFGIFGDDLFGGVDTEATESAMRLHQAATEPVATMTARPTNTATSTVTLTPTASATFTPTLRPTTESGLTIYDNFNGQSGSASETRWTWANIRYVIENDYLRLHIPFAFQCCDAGLRSVEEWKPAPSGSIRFATEVRMLVNDPIKHRNSWIFFQLDFPSDFIFSFGYHVDFGPPDFFCEFYKLESEQRRINYLFEEFGDSRTEEWHLFRISVEEQSDSDDLAIVGYIDDEQVCDVVPPTDWQDMIETVGQNELYITLDNGGYDYWGLDVPSVARFDDIAVYPFDE